MAPTSNNTSGQEAVTAPESDFDDGDKVAGENLSSPRKVYLFDDAPRFYRDRSTAGLEKGPAYYVKQKSMEAFNKELLTHTEDWSGDYSHFWTNRLLNWKPEDEVRAAIGAYWAIDASDGGLSPNFFQETDANVNGISNNTVVYPRITHQDVTSVEKWYMAERGSADKGNERNIPERREKITIRTPRGADKHLKGENLSLLAAFAKRIYFNELKFVYNKDVYYKTTGKRHIDYTTIYYKPFSFKELEATSYMNKPLYYKCKSDYNFYVKDYENLDWRLPGERLDDTVLLPNMNVFLMEEISPDRIPGKQQFTEFHKFVTLKNQLPDMFKDALNEKGEKIGEKSKGQYFEKWSRVYNSKIAVYGGVDRQVFSTMRNKHANILAPYEMNKRMVEYHYKRFMFPMFFELEFSTDTNTSLADLLVDAKLDGAILKTMIEGGQGNFADGMKNRLKFKSNVAADSGDEIFTVEKNAARSGWGSARGFREVKKASTDFEEVIDGRSSFSFYDDSFWNWTDQFADKGAEIFANKTGEDFTVLAELDSEYYNMLHESEDDGGQSKFLKNLLMTIFQARFMNLVKDKTRSFRQILSGKTAPSETIAYRVAKWRCNAAGTPVEVIQNYYYSNTRKLDVLKHIDTQMRYGERYHYRIYAWRVIFGTEYEYKIDRKYLANMGNLATAAMAGEEEIKKRFEKVIKKYSNDTATYDFEVDIISRPNVKVVEVPYFSCATRMMDSPPIPPNINILPYKNVNNKVLINLSSNTGEVKQEPIIIETENGDAESLKEIYEAQELPQGSIIEFQSEDPPQTFQVFRTTIEPASYQDFKGTMREHGVEGFSSFSLVDNLIPNTKYYYTFRVKDVHGHVSNPSEVYKVELVDNSGAVYLLIDIFEMKKKKPKSTKVMRRYISVIPQPEQRFIDETKTGIEFDESEVGTTAVNLTPELGLAEESIFNRGPEKYFKIRLISKKTGRKIDVNVVFETKHMNIEVKKKEDIRDSDSGTTVA